MEIAADGSAVVAARTVKSDDEADKSRNQNRVKAAKIDYQEAAQKMPAGVLGGTITELNPDTEQDKTEQDKTERGKTELGKTELGKTELGKTVWEGDILDGSVKRSVQIDAADGNVISDNTGS
ncbi:hypothetical protein IV500_02510 [Paeniglutamicibacter antarcticus]|uniref:Peptidase propeptide and YPEB domain-containing protein n=1 Tax=Arthrobacter terrae TaxID=2935737 RepID=A0A931CMT4_9MICC|nr:hypothetical protein [Arthrobacter terrae]MBG0738304.1 hypothetical protein [Arthrobacter terrae]